MKKSLLLACILVAFQFPTMGWAQIYVLDTGPGDTGVSTPRNLCYHDLILGDQWLAVQFSLPQTAPVLSVEGFMCGEGVGGTGTIALYSGAAFPTPGAEFFSTSFTVPSNFADDWYGAGMNVPLSAGTYWAAFEGSSLDQLYASLASQTPNPAAAYGYSDGIAQYATLAGQDAPDFGVRIVVPEPTVSALLAAGLLLLGLRRRYTRVKAFFAKSCGPE
jgi:hypothetical protein